MKLNMEWLKHWKNGIKYVDRLLNFYYTCVKTQWIWRTTRKGAWEKTVFQGVGKFSKIMLPRACSASNVSWKTTYLKIQPHVSLLLALSRKNKHSSVSSPRPKLHGQCPRPSTNPRNRFSTVRDWLHLPLQVPTGLTPSSLWHIDNGR